MITQVFAGMPVDDFETAVAWYQIFVGRPPDLVPRAGDSAWQLAGTGWIYVVDDAERAGKGLLTLLVDDLQEHVGFLAMRGIAPDSIETVPGVVRTAIFFDPARNKITIGQPLAGDAGG